MWIKSVSIQTEFLTFVTSIIILSRRVTDKRRFEFRAQSYEAKFFKTHIQFVIIKVKP